MGKEKKLKQERRIVRMELSRERSQKIKFGWIIAITLLVVASGVVYYFWWDEKQQEEPKILSSPVAVIETDKGTIKFEMFPDAAPKTVENFIKLADEGFYNGTTFHRVEPNFVIQGGDPEGDGTGGPGYTFEDEINAKSLGLSDERIVELEKQGYAYRDDIVSLRMEPGSVAMANSGPNTNGSQFFIVIDKSQPHLDGKHTVFGRVVEGQDVVSKIEIGDVMNSVRVEMIGEKKGSNGK